MDNGHRAALATVIRGVLSSPWVALAVALASGVLTLLPAHGGASTWSIWPPAALTLLAAVQALRRLAAEPRPTRLRRLIVPALFGALVLWLWEVVTVGAGVPPVLLPAPSAIGARFAASLDVLSQDAVQTFLRAVVTGWVLGSALGFTTALLADRWPFLARGLLPLAGLASALPLVGIAPIAVMWLGFDWQSKAAVVTVMTFFPMLVATTTGLAATGRIERDLMRSYAASWWRTLTGLRLPAAMPFVFNALKLNSTAALIGAIVAEFFGTPTVGMGFRISIEIGRMNLDMVWAEIALAALLGSAAYAGLGALERVVTHWHPSMR